MITNLTEKPSIAHSFIAELRDIHIQNDRMRFRRNLERIGEILAYEISQALDYQDIAVQTPLSILSQKKLKTQPVVASILRAGLPLQTGLLNIFDAADAAFISAYRKHNADDSFSIEIEYLSCPSLNERVLILADPMLATGASVVKAVEKLAQHGNPLSIHIVSAIAAQAGVDFVREKLPHAHLWLGAIDPILNPKMYIVPGLGDAGDLAFGGKLQR